MLLFTSIRPYFTDPLIWIGVILLLIFLLIKYLLNQKIISQLPKWLENEPAKKLITHGYFLGIFVIVLGLSLQYNELGKAELDSAKSLIQTEVNDNLASINQISQNTQSLMVSHKSVYEALRKTDSQVMKYLFPSSEQISDKSTQLSQKVEAAFTTLKDSNLLKNKTAMNAFNASKNQISTIVFPINANLKTMQNPKDKKTDIKTENYQIHKEVIARFDGFDPAKYEQSLDAMHALMNQYSLTLQSSADYIDEVSNFLEPSPIIGNGAVFKILTKEKQSLNSLMKLNANIKAVLSELQTQPPL